MINEVSGGARNKRPQQQNVRKIESSDDFLKADMEEGKTSAIGDFAIKSPNIQKKRIDFGQGNPHSLDSQHIWTYSQANQK